VRPEEFQRIAELFDAARQLSPAERARYLDEACAGGSALRAEVESLLAHHDDDSGVLSDDGSRRLLQSAAARVLAEKDAPRSLVTGKSAVDPHTSHPTQIGRYTVVREIGVGGMGVVYEARQESPRRTVALKMIRVGAVSPQVRKRFEQEANVLGGLQHEGIAQIYEAGTADTPTGPHPFFAMEFVDGLSMMRFAAKHSLAPPDRLRLFLRVCDAVAFAHRHGIIHRDLKPANILVNQNGQPKILDFGVARVTDADLRTTTLQTEAGQLIGTLPYMSPEQVSGNPAALDFRTDVYALGVLLFELLSGRLPHELKHKSVPDAARIIKETEPTRLSSVDRTFRGDLETIVAKTLEKEKERRYPSVDELASDIRRFLADEPIVARPPSTLYQFRKFAKRNKTLVGGLAAVFLTLAVGIAGTTMGMVRATRAENLAHSRLRGAERQAAVTEAVNEFLNDDLLSLADPENSPDRELTLRAAIDQSASKVEERFADEPLTEAAIRVTLGRTYRQLAEYDIAEGHLTRAIALREELLGPAHNDTLKALNHLGILYDQRGRFEEAIALYRRVLVERLRSLGPDHDDTLSTANNLGLTLMDTGQYEEAEKWLVDTYERRTRLHPSDHEDYLLATNNLASFYWERGQYRKALPLYEQTLAGRRRALGDDHPNTINSIDNLATCLVHLNRPKEAAALSTDALERARRVLGPDHPRTLAVSNNLASAYIQQLEFEKAEPIFAEVIATIRRTGEPQHWTLGVALSNQALCLRSMNELQRAEQCLLEANQILETTFGPKHERTLNVVEQLATTYELLNDNEKAQVWRDKLAAARDPKTNDPSTEDD
jgi:tetratricopeptide (TPR) repeat protein/predicted Ser/Thr protein kinase